MSGIIRWRDIQNLLVTEDQINLLEGLAVSATLLNQFSGFTGNGSTLNTVISNAALYAAHLNADLASGHTLTPNTIDGGVLVNGTVAKNKLAFTALDSVDLLNINNDIATLNTSLDQVSTQVQSLFTVLFPSVTGDIAEQFAQLVNHIQQLEDAHDATAISFGNDYTLTSSLVAGATQAAVSLSSIRFFEIGDTVEFKDTNSGPETRVLTGVDYNGGQIGWTTGLLQAYATGNSAKVKNLSQANVQTGIQRSLRNSTDTFTGRLTINQSGIDSALVVNHTGTNYTAQFNNFTGKTQDSFKLNLGKADGTSYFNISDSNDRVAFNVLDNGEALTGNLSLRDYLTTFTGKITKQSLTADRTWTLPNRSGFIGVGDLTFSELLKVALVPATKQLTIAPGFKTDYSGQTVSAWISMDKPSAYTGATIDIQAKFITDNQLLTLANKWQVFVLYINDSDVVNFFYGPQRVNRLDAITDYVNYIPSAYMKLAKIIVQGDGLGGIAQSSIEILEDQRPFLTMGLSASFYDESVTAASGYSAGTILTLPNNTRAGGIVQTYRIGKAQLEVYIDGVYQMVNQDYEENQGEPVGKIRLLKNVQTGSAIRYRITFVAAAVAGGIDTPTLQSTYMAGPLLNMSNIYGPIIMSSFDMDMLLSIGGSVNITNKIYNLRNLLFNPISSLIGDTDKNQLYVDTNSDLIYHQYKLGVEKDYNILSELDDAKTVMRMPMFNGAGFMIPKGRAVALHPSLPNAIVLCDTSSSLSTSRCIGVTLANIGIGETGDIITGGLFKLTGLGIAHNTVVAVDPRNPGLIVPKSSITYLPTDKVEVVGVVDGGNLILDLVHDIERNTIWKTGIAGEAFNANETRLVRFAVNGETRGRVYKADKANANLDQKFWVVAAVCPSTAVAAGDTINLYKDVSLALTETAFDDEDMGKPLYLTDAGQFKSWRLLNGSFTVGDAAIKIGMIEDRKKFIVDSVQMMGTAPGPSF